jgi:hypothetical protein
MHTVLAKCNAKGDSGASPTWLCTPSAVSIARLRPPNGVRDLTPGPVCVCGTGFGTIRVSESRWIEMKGNEGKGGSALSFRRKSQRDRERERERRGWERVSVREGRDVGTLLRVTLGPYAGIGLGLWMLACV